MEAAEFGEQHVTKHSIQLFGVWAQHYCEYFMHHFLYLCKHSWRRVFE